MKSTDELIVQTDISNSYHESAILKLTKMVLNINENNTVGIDSDVCIGIGYILQIKDLAREIIGDYDDNKE